MDTAQDILSRETLIVLPEADIQTCPGEFALLPALEEMAARITEEPRTDQHDIRYRGRLEFHLSSRPGEFPAGMRRKRIPRALRQAPRVERHRYSLTDMQS